MGSVMNTVTDFVGLTDHEAEQDARDAANKQAAISNQMTADEIAFQREQYNDWKEIYGPLQEDLGTYFKNLTGDSLAAQQVEQIQQASQQSQIQTDQALAQRGLTGSGIEAQALMQNQFGTEMQKASARANADQLAAQQQMGFLGLGLGQGTTMLGINANVANTGASVAGNMSSSALSNATSLSQSNSAMMGNLLEGAYDAAGGASGISSMFSDRRLKMNITKVGVIKGITFYKWTWNAIANSLGHFGESFGVIADEVKDIIPNSVVRDKETGYDKVNYGKVIEGLQ